MKQENSEIRLIAVNRRASHEYTLTQQWEAGIILTGPEIKAIRAGQVNFADSYISVETGEAWLLNLHISADVPSGHYDPTRKRKLLLHKVELRKIIQKVTIKGFTLIPTRIYLKQQWAKVSFSLAQGKTKYDKRQSLKKKEIRREMRME